VKSRASGWLGGRNGFDRWRIAAAAAPLGVGATLGALIGSAGIVGVAGVIAGRWSLALVLWYAFFAVVPLATSAGLLLAGLEVLRRGSSLAGMLSSAGVLFASVIAGANSQWMQPDLNFRTNHCGTEGCRVALATAGLPTWNAQRWIALVIAALAVMSIISALAMTAQTRRAVGTAVLVLALVVVTQKSIAHAESSARFTRASCAKFLAYVAGTPRSADHEPIPTRGMIEACRDPRRHATSEG
jgi:hypothetical protein